MINNIMIKDKEIMTRFQQFSMVWHADIRALNVEHRTLSKYLSHHPHHAPTVSRLFQINTILLQRKELRKQFTPTMYIVEDGVARCVNCSRIQAHAMVGMVYEP